MGTGDINVSPEKGLYRHPSFHHCARWFPAPVGLPPFATLRWLCPLRCVPPSHRMLRWPSPLRGQAHLRTYVLRWFHPIRGLPPFATLRWLCPLRVRTTVA